MAHTRSDAVVDAPEHGTYHFLDVGGEKYGDCVLVQFGDVRVLIDGSHVKDYEGQTGYDSIPEQLKDILGDPPYAMTLVVVTHGHNDHIGCLPALVEHDIIRPKWALITDPKLGFGRGVGDDSTYADLADERARVLAAALREEDASDLSDAELREFLDAASTVEPRYAAFVRKLEADGVNVIEYKGARLPNGLTALMRATGMQLFGPSQLQLLRCADQISRTNEDALDAVQSALAKDATLDDVQLYRAIVADASEEDARKNPRGSGMNCQSITLAFGPAGARVLLAGDMQFTEPGVTGVDDEIKALRRAVVAGGPYKVFKTTHHTSHNGQDDALLTELGNPPIVVHTGGLRDKDHPYPTVLAMLKARRGRLKFARTDRNGRITIRPHLQGERAIEISKGRLNDFTDNIRDIEVSALESGPVVLRETTRPAGSPGRIIIVELPDGPLQMSVAGVDIVVRDAVSEGPSGRSESGTRGDRGSARPRIEAPRHGGSLAPVNLAAGRELPRLMFVTNAERLIDNIGREEAQGALDAIRARGHIVVEVAGDADAAAATVRKAVIADGAIKGVVIAGGYDVVPSAAVDVLGPALRNTLGDAAGEDNDDFIVWSDEVYGDLDGDRVGELPVSRVPDARDGLLFRTALQADAVVAGERFGIRNVNRPFAEQIWPGLAGARGLNISEAFTWTDVVTDHLAASCHYFMLHGRVDDATEFSGEYEKKAGYPRAFTIDNVPSRCRGLVFSGCCWAALTVSQSANEIGNRSPAPRVPERSIALSYLKAGANSFIGCTGSHYSGPDEGAKANYAHVLHEAFWEALARNNYCAAPTLFQARRQYAQFLARGDDDWDSLDIARRLKNRAQFTCLGLGW